MAFKLIERIKYKMNGRSVPVLKATDIEETGKIRSLQYLGQVKRRANSLIATWDSKGWEIQPGQTMITIIMENGLSSVGYVVSEAGSVIDLYTRKPSEFPNREDIIGKAATMDDIGESMDLGKSMKNVVVGMFLGAPIWWMVFVMLNRAMS
jgi:hypothetical protein